ncbi:MAG: hypothetical protein IKW74_00170, partial [Thermoguttaceae bacterium]|nr:hypothetical protein [Thermoguttaceae bacterium]
MTEAEPELSPEELLSREKPFSDPTYGTEVIPSTPDTADRTPIKTLQPKPMDSLPGLDQNTNSSTTIPEISSEIPNVQNFDSVMTLPQQSYQSGGMGKSRNEDGSMRGNPYSSEYNQNYSGSFATPKSLRDIPPVAAYGKNMWGEPSIPTCPGANCGWLYWLTKNLEAEIGILGFRNPLDIENNGNFGADAALNWSIPKRICFGLAAQGGARVTQTALNGTNDNGFETNKQRTQLFWTSGIFYRNPCCNWQWGVVYDSLNDSYYRHYTLGQVRGELSCRWTDHCDLGFRGAFGLNTKLVNFWRFDDDVYAKTNATPTSYYTGFIRKYFDFGGEGIFYGGVTEWGEGLIGGQIEAPLSNHCSLKNDFMYVFAKDRGLQKSYEQTWNISASLVIYIDGNSCEQLRNPLKPLFDVANNG